MDTKTSPTKKLKVTDTTSEGKVSLMISLLPDFISIPFSLRAEIGCDLRPYIFFSKLQRAPKNIRIFVLGFYQLTRDGVGIFKRRRHYFLINLIFGIILNRNHFSGQPGPSNFKFCRVIHHFHWLKRRIRNRFIKSKVELFIGNFIGSY